MPVLSEMFAANVPRYTSYPTAPHFHGGINADVQRQWLAQLPADEPLSLYAHIPFCDSLCWFCACHTTAVNNYAPVSAYCETLLQEIGQVADSLPRRMAVKHIHWGGGSPTMLNANDVARLNDTIRSRFDVLPHAEFAVEIDPRGFTPTMAATLAGAGVNRASLGVQDCNPAVQRAINRIQSDDETFDTIALMRSEGVASINIDMVYGLPLQTLESWSQTLDFILWLKPDRIAVFGYAHVPSFKKHQALIPDSLLPDVDTRFHMAEMARQVLCKHGYAAIGIDHYALASDALAHAASQGTLHRNFQGYTTDSASTLIGFGASAISALPQGYVQNAAATPEYRRLIATGGLAAVRGVALAGQDRRRRAIIERLMCDLAVDLDAFGVPGEFHSAFPALEKLERQGLLHIDGARIAIQPEWRAAARLVGACFDEYLDSARTRHSVAV